MVKLTADPRSLDAAASSVRSAPLDGVDTAAAATLRTLADSVGGGSCADAASRLAWELGTSVSELASQLARFAAAGHASSAAYRRADQLTGDPTGGAR